jgi:pyridoxamine 5'-phosphate oxidase
MPDPAVPDRPLLDVAALREEYSSVPLTEADASADPIEQFDVWLRAALAEGIPEPNAMVVATTDPSGRPSARTVLLKGVDARGFTFFTNTHSRKGRELAASPVAALVFPWITIRRQITVRGAVQAVGDAESDAYFATRPRGSQLAAWASEQSQVLDARATLEGRMREVIERFGDGPVPRPPHWGGYRVHPDEVEFWQGRPDRMHDRLRYTRAGAVWHRDRLWP